MPSAAFSHTAVASASPEAAYASLQHADTWESIAGVDEVSDPRHDEEGRLLGYRFTVEVGGRRYPGTAVVTGSEPPHSMTVKIDTSEVAGDIRVRLASDDARTEVTVELAIASKGFLSTLVFPVISTAIGSGLEASVESFAGRLG